MGGRDICRSRPVYSFDFGHTIFYIYIKTITIESEKCNLPLEWWPEDYGKSPYMIKLDNTVKYNL